MKRIIKMTAVVCALSFVLAGCTKTTEAGSASSQPTSVETAAQPQEQEKTAAAGLTAPIAETPLLLTSVGQNADVQMVKTVMEKREMSVTYEALADTESIGDNKTLILVVGGSSKGLGAAGIEVGDEQKRIDDLIAAAREKSVTIIGMHVGGEGRRGDLSDRFINAVCGKVDYLIVVEDGNKDGLFTQIAEDNQIPIDFVAKIAEVSTPLQNAVK